MVEVDRYLFVKKKKIKIDNFWKYISLVHASYISINISFLQNFM